MSHNNDYPVPGSVHRDWLDKGGLSPRIMRYIEHVEGEAAALRADLEQTTDERNALLHARTALRDELEKFADEAEKDAAEIFALRAERDKWRRQCVKNGQRATTVEAANTELRAELAEANREIVRLGVVRDGLIGASDRLEAELERVTTERDDAYALIRHYADTDPEVALAERMRPVVVAAKAWASRRRSEPGAPGRRARRLIDAVDAYRLATSEQEASDATTFHCYVCDTPDGECDREKHRARDEQEADDA